MMQPWSIHTQSKAPRFLVLATRVCSSSAIDTSLRYLIFFSRNSSESEKRVCYDVHLTSYVYSAYSRLLDVTMCSNALPLKTWRPLSNRKQHVSQYFDWFKVIHLTLSRTSNNPDKTIGNLALTDFLIGFHTWAYMHGWFINHGLRWEYGDLRCYNQNKVEY